MKTNDGLPVDRQVEKTFLSRRSKIEATAADDVSKSQVPSGGQLEYNQDRPLSKTKSIISGVKSSSRDDSWTNLCLRDDADRSWKRWSLYREASTHDLFPSHPVPAACLIILWSPRKSDLAEQFVRWAFIFNKVYATQLISISYFASCHDRLHDLDWIWIGSNDGIDYDPGENTFSVWAADWEFQASAHFSGDAKEKSYVSPGEAEGCQHDGERDGTSDRKAGNHQTKG